MVRRTLSAARDARVIAADGGARVAQYYGLSVDLVIGDMDSLTDAELDALAQGGTTIARHPAQKNETDLELALLAAVEGGARWLRILGGIGDRLDQTLSNVYLMALPALRGCDVRLVAGKQEARLLYAGTTQIDGAAGDTISLLPLSGVARAVRTAGLYYPLRDEDLSFGPARGVSNVLDANSATVTLQEGVLLLIHTIGRA